MSFSPARQQFIQEIQAPEPQIDLAKAALYLAQEEFPELEPMAYLNALDTMAVEIQERLPVERYPLRVLQVMNQYLFTDLGFVGSRENYYDPDNSYLNQVIDRRTGIPITLSLVYLALAQRIDFPMVGIGMPGHFLIRPDFADAGIYVDAFNQGEILFPVDCEARLSQIYGQPVQLQPEFLEPVGSRQFLARMLTNLKVIYVNQNQIDKALGAVERILLLFPEALSERRDRGLLYYQLDQWREARKDLEFYLAKMPSAPDEQVVRRLLERIDWAP
ncbi:MAG: tetratricopeptide repeat protein [Oscillatoriales cyanobacterium RM2_1_1]|nr:tetratricopeptide repeat protein [Oscillatoriales cyanobacterium SM2_3_0]NJO44234.1 tetratricopeptide repeat protein [Oscillatoriales cyanobacterium RM2_1_1]